MHRSYAKYAVAGFSFLLVVTHSAAAAQWKPERNIEIIAGTNPGGAADRTARTIQKIAQDRKLIEVPVAVVNKPGAGGAIGWTYIGQRAGDGHFLAIATPPLLTNHITGKNVLHYRDFTPIAHLFGEYFPFVVRADSPIRTGKDLIEKLRQDPGAVNVAVASSGGANHIAVGLVAKKAGIDPRKLKIVVFNSGGDTLTALLGGHVQLVAANPASAEPHVKSGKLRAVAVAAERRLAATYADVPTWREQGVDAVLMTWRGIIGPRGLGAGEVAYWEQAFGRLTKTEDWKQDLRKNLWEEHYLTSAAMRKFLDAEYDELKGVLTDLGLAK